MSRAGLEKQGCREYFRRGLRKKGQRGRIKKFSGVVSFFQSTNTYPGLPWWPGGQDSVLPVQRAWV